MKPCNPSANPIFCFSGEPSSEAKKPYLWRSQGTISTDQSTRNCVHAPKLRLAEAGAWEPTEDHDVGSACSARGMRIALFSGNYNCVRDGANKALNRLVGFLLDEGAEVRIYSPTVAEPAFEPVGDVVSIPSISIPGRPEYRLGLALTPAVRRDVRRFAPTHFHISAPDIVGKAAQNFARKLNVPVIASLHTRFESYLDYYGLWFLATVVQRHLRSFYCRSDLVLAPNQPLADLLRVSGLSDRVRIWGRGVDHELFSPAQRDMEWRRTNGWRDNEVIILFLGRLVVEKGLKTFVRVVEEIRERGYPVRPLIVGDGPARRWMESELPDTSFTGHLEGPELARAVASADVLLNPSITEAFGNVNLEAMAAGVAVVSADVGSARALIQANRSGLLVEPDDVAAYADALEALTRSPLRRRSMAVAARSAAASYVWPEILGSVLDAYRSCWSPPRPRLPGPVSVTDDA